MDRAGIEQYPMRTNDEVFFLYLFICRRGIGKIFHEARMIKKPLNYFVRIKKLLNTDIKIHHRRCCCCIQTNYIFVPSTNDRRHSSGKQTNPLGNESTQHGTHINHISINHNLSFVCIFTRAALSF